MRMNSSNNVFNNNVKLRNISKRSNCLYKGVLIFSGLLSRYTGSSYDKARDLSHLEGQFKWNITRNQLTSFPHSWPLISEGSFSLSHLLTRHETSIFNGHVCSFTFVAERLAVEISLPVLASDGTRTSISRMQCKCSTKWDLNSEHDLYSLYDIKYFN